MLLGAEGGGEAAIGTGGIVDRRDAVVAGLSFLHSRSRRIHRSSSRV